MVEIVRYRSEFAAAVARLQKRLWSPDIELNAAYLRWKYDLNPYGDWPIYLALDQDRVVGMRGAMGASWEVGNPPQKYLIPCAGDLVIDPEYRSQGIFGQIMGSLENELREREIPYLFNWTANPVNLIASLAAGWKMTPPLGALLREYQASRPMRLVRKRVQWLANRIPPFATLALGAMRMDRHLSVETLPRREAMADLVSRLKRTRIRHQRDVAYFGWRYRNPLSQYRFVFWDDDRLEGYLVLGATERLTGTEFTIMDWEATAGEILEELLGAALLGKFPNLSVWSAGLSAAHRRLFEMRGFHPIPEGRSVSKYRSKILVRPVAAEASGPLRLGDTELLDLTNWHLRLAYSDGV